ncbi:MAG: hypothetical protein H6747_11815 [Deltaproteobacteria bacterium]|nr:hypothetical protein [Deltaproteobacteria bacterium]
MQARSQSSASSPARTVAMRLVAIALSGPLLGCSGEKPPPPPPTTREVVRPLVLPDLTKRIRAEVTAMVQIVGATRDGARRLGESNLRLQRRGYFRRIPSNPTIPALRANLGAAVVSAGLTLELLEIDDDPRGTKGTAAATIAPGERWTPDREAMLGRLRFHLQVRGDQSGIIDFIDKLPARVERLVLIRGHRPVAGGVELFGEAYFERTPEAPKVTLEWPTLEAWLRSAGHDPDDTKLRADPEFKALEQAVRAGREVAPDARDVLGAAMDLPRWRARGAIFDEVSAAIAAVHGDAILAAAPVPADGGERAEVVPNKP